MEKVDIIGGGIAGLALAARLDPGRFDVTIHEQRPELPGVGTTLAMWSGAQAALAELGLLETLKAAGARLASGALRDPSGHPMLAMQGNVLMGISRPGLLRMLDSAVPPSVTRITGKVAELPNNGALLVGADGVHSIVRRTAWGSRTQARPTPFLAVRGVIPSQPSPSDVGEYWGSATLFGLAPTGSGTNWYASFRSGLGPDQVDVEEALALTRHIFQHHSPAVQHVLGEATPETSLAQRIWTTPPMARYAKEGIVLLGDAAHAMTPNLGRGACEALVDAVTLGRLLNELPRKQALAAYNKQRVLPTQQLRIASSLMGRVALAETMHPLRDLLLKSAGRRVATRRKKVPTPE
ncbi:MULTISPECIES: FAD-dependent monooxygenase [Paenarthrobacter]|uniref:FAD-dependent monooxygenase n=1 Tax=Paenarthrobacter TaxID=1742992 RepID=UPI000A9FB250|nr:FAD-dependent monooxygenase [Paenarthrobacter ureafaciens]